MVQPLYCRLGSGCYPGYQNGNYRSEKSIQGRKLKILNSDQRCQFTSQRYIDFVKENGIYQSMKGKSHWADNIMIERWFRSFKYEEAYLTQYNNIKEAREAIGRYIHSYNFERCHSALAYKTPAECCYPAMMLPCAEQSIHGFWEKLALTSSLMNHISSL